MIYDDAAAHMGAPAFPDDAPIERAGTHLGLLLAWCFSRGWAGEVHISTRPEAVDAVVSGDMGGTEFLFAHCTGALRDQDVTPEAAAFLAKYCTGNGAFWLDYIRLVGAPYRHAESEVDGPAFEAMINARYAAHARPRRKRREGESLDRFRDSDEARRARGDPDAPPVIPWRETGFGMVVLGAGLVMSIAKSCGG